MGRWPWTWEWRGAAILVLIYQADSGRLRAAYAVDESSGGLGACDTLPPADSILVDRAEDLLHAVGWPYARRDQASISSVGTDFRAVREGAGDFTATVVYHTDGAMVLAWSAVWGGSGTQYYPSDPIDPWLLTDGAGLAAAPTTFTELEPEWPDSLILQARRLAVVQDLAQRPYTATGLRTNREMQGPYDTNWVLLLVSKGNCWK